MQLGIRNDEAAAKAEAAGLTVIKNRCPKIEYGRLGGELSWSGVNTRHHLEPPRAAARMTDDRAAASRGRRSTSTSYGFETRAVHAGAPPDPVTGAAQHADLPDDLLCLRGCRPRRRRCSTCQNFGYIYSRITNPTVSALEERVAAWRAAAPPSPPPRATPRSCSRSTR